MIQQEILKRKLPELLKMNDGRICILNLWEERKKEILDILQKYVYGYTPKPPKKVAGQIIKQSSERSFAGKVNQQTIKISFNTPEGEFLFPLELFLPKDTGPVSFFLHIAFRPNIPDKYCPIEEITDNGFGLGILYYKDIVNDNLHGDFSDGLGKLYIGERERECEEWGKIGMWAYAASRALDYILTRKEIDPNRIAVVGHSRLGKTALWCAAQDERFFMAISNNSGIKGAAISKLSTGENIADFIKAGSSIKEIAKERELTLVTIMSHIQQYITEGNKIDFEIPLDEFFNDEEEKMVLDAIDKVGYNKLKDIKEVVPEEITYDAIRAIVLKKVINEVNV